MPLWLLGSIVVIGLAAIWVAMRVFGFTDALKLDDATVRREFEIDNPGRKAGDIWIAESGEAALVCTDKTLFVLWVMGQDAATHDLTHADLRDTSTGLTLILKDFAAPRLDIRLTPDEAKAWTTLIEEART